MARLFWPALLLAILLLAACDPGADDGGDAAAEEETPAIPVETATPTRGDIVALYSGTAPVEAFADVTVIAKVSGEVREILVEEGDDVQSGDVLLRLDGDRLRLEVQQVEANLLKLQRDHQRNVDLKERGLISAGDFEKIQYEMEALRASFDLATLELSYTEIRAPITGVISERFVKLGNTLDVNAPTFKITSLEPLISYLHVPEREFRRINVGQAATIQVDALADDRFAALVARVSPVVDPDAGTFKITIEVSDPSRRLKPGMFARISIVHDVHADALQIPRSAIVEEAGESAVYVIDEDIATRRVIRTGYTEGGRVEVLEGLAEGEEFVVIGQNGLKTGSRVAVINANAPAATAVSNDAAQ